MDSPRDLGAEYSLLFSASPIAMWVFDLETLRFLAVNEAAVARYGFTRDEFLGMTLADIRPPEDVPALITDVRAQRATDLRGSELWRHRRKDGALFTVQITAQDVVFEGRRARLVVAQDLSERDRVAVEVRKEHQFLQSILDGMPAVVLVKDLEYRYTLVNTAWERFSGVTRGQAIGKTSHDVFPVAVADNDRRADEATINTLAQTETEQVVASDQGPLTYVTSRSPLRGEDGLLEGLIGVSVDLTESRRAERALGASEMRYSRLFEAAQDGILIINAETAEIVDINPFLCDLLAFSRDDVLGRKLWEIGPFKDESAPRVSFRRLQEAGYIRYEDLPLETSTGQKIAVEFVSNVYRMNGGKVIQCNVRDITQRKRVDEEHAVLARASEQSAESIVITDPQGTILYVNPSFEKTSGYSRAEAIGQNTRILKSGQHDAGFYRHMWDALNRGEIWKGRMVNRRRDGTLVQEDATIGPVRDASGRVVNYVAVKRDVTKEMYLERQLMQAQRMEAVGRLAGGVAHDFNNLLGVIIGYAETTREKLPDDDPLRVRVDEILRAAERAAGLTRQLLAFSRQQVLQPQIVDLNGLVANLHKMLLRLLGEDIELGTSLAPDLGNVRADPGQIEQVLMNLVVNARDAMPEGGRVRIETRNAEIDGEAVVGGIAIRAGSYVVVALTDSGAGIDAETQSHLFEPFFTTKEMGKGTGLGLSTAYGIVKQSEGYILCESEVGVGTTFKVYLPRVDKKASTAPRPTAARPAQGSETLLLIEDDDSLRELIFEILEGAGYTVLVSPDSAKAIQIADEHAGRIHLVVTDVIMPGGTGRQAADCIRSARPDVAVLFMSGYTGDIIARHGVLSAEQPFLSKPFTSVDLLHKIRAVLDRDDS